MKGCECQRILDCFFSFISLILLVPIFIIVIPLLFFTGENKIFFSQFRIGKNKKKFRLLKFATMLEKSSSMKNGTLTVKGDSRILPVGKILRKTKLTSFHN